tara:strand:+ start:345 stop:527 length:183 start_codon:yes stop_codon:yes gene_type:complete
MIPIRQKNHIGRNVGLIDSVSPTICPLAALKMKERLDAEELIKMKSRHDVSGLPLKKNQR